jgi:DNA-binding NarL/FixJ family response regulator
MFLRARIRDGRKWVKLATAMFLKGAKHIMQPRERLTVEVQVANSAVESLTNREIGEALGTTEQVVKRYLRNTFDKPGVWSRLELARYVASHGGEAWNIPVSLAGAGGPRGELAGF